MKEGENGTKHGFMVLHLRRVIGGLARINMGSVISRDPDLNKRQTHPDTSGTHTQADR